METIVETEIKILPNDTCVNGGDNKLIKFAMTALRLTKQTTVTVQSDLTSVILLDENNLREFSLDDVANHDHFNDCWIVIYNRVYDLTKFLALHPGGENIILEQAGRDATLAFRGTGHSKAALMSLKQWEIGQLPKHERIFYCNMPE